MYDLRLPSDEHDAVLRYLAGSHRYTVRVQIIDLDHHFLSNISDQVIDGQVSVNMDGEEATRTLELAVFDPDYDLGFDTSDFADGVWFLDRMVQVIIEFHVPEINRKIEVPVFTGPVRGYKRKRSVVTLSCVGKDIFGRGAWQRFVLKKGTNQVTAMRQVLENFGETKFRFEATSNTKLKKDKVVDRSATQTPWGWCRSTATSLGLRIYYDGGGYVCLRNTDTSKPLFEFRDGDGGTVLTEPEPEGDYSTIANVILAQGPAVGNRKPPSYIAKVPTSSPLHPSKFRRGGKPVYMGRVILRDSITSTGTAKTAATTELNRSQRVAYAVSTDALPLWMLEEGDPVRYDVGGVKTTSTIRTFSFGLGPAAVMPIGYKKLLSPTIAKIRRL